MIPPDRANLVVWLLGHLEALDETVRRVTHPVTSETHQKDALKFLETWTDIPEGDEQLVSERLARWLASEREEGHLCGGKEIEKRTEAFHQELLHAVTREIDGVPIESCQKMLWALVTKKFGLNPGPLPDKIDEEHAVVSAVIRAEKAELTLGAVYDAMEALDRLTAGDDLEHVQEMHAAEIPDRFAVLYRTAKKVCRNLSNLVEEGGPETGVSRGMALLRRLRLLEGRIRLIRDHALADLPSETAPLGNRLQHIVGLVEELLPDEEVLG